MGIILAAQALRTWDLIPSTHIKSQVLWCMSVAEAEGPLKLSRHSGSVRGPVSKILCGKQLRVALNEHLIFTDMFTPNMFTFVQHKHSIFSYAALCITGHCAGLSGDCGPMKERSMRASFHHGGWDMLEALRSPWRRHLSFTGCGFPEKTVGAVNCKIQVRASTRFGGHRVSSSSLCFFLLDKIYSFLAVIQRVKECSLGVVLRSWPSW